MAHFPDVEVNLKAVTDPLIPKLVAALETIESVGWWRVCRNEAIGVLIDKNLSDKEARDKALGWLQHSLVGMPDTGTTPPTD